MKLKDFDELGIRDFQNGAVHTQIREALKERDKLRDAWKVFHDLKELNVENKQSVRLEAGFAFDRADKIIKFLVDHGFSVEAKYQNEKWSITGEKQT